MKKTEIKCKDFYITARLTVSYPGDWSEEKLAKEFASRLNTHLCLNDTPFSALNRLILEDVSIDKIEPGL